MRELDDIVLGNIILIVGWGAMLIAVKYVLEFLQP